MFQSMTGYASKEVQVNNFKVFIQVKSYNSKHLDITFKLSRTFDRYEYEIRQLILDKIKRGKVEVIVRVEENGSYVPESVDVNIELAKKYRDALKKLSQELGLLMEFDISHFVSLDGIIVFEKQSADELWNVVKNELIEVVDDFVATRLREGERTVEDIKSSLSVVKKLVSEVEERTGEIEEKIKEKLKRKVEELVGNKVDETMILNEVGIMVVRYDVNEEVERLKGHIAEMEKTLNENDGPSGRRLEFLLQEMLRETNTLGAKTPIYEVNADVVRIKEEIEKMREQARNLE